MVIKQNEGVFILSQENTAQRSLWLSLAALMNFCVDLLNFTDFTSLGSWFSSRIPLF